MLQLLICDFEVFKSAVCNMAMDCCWLPTTTSFQSNREHFGPPLQATCRVPLLPNNGDGNRAVSPKLQIPASVRIPVQMLQRTGSAL